MLILKRTWMTLATLLSLILLGAMWARPVVIDPHSKAPVGGPMPECAHSWGTDSAQATLDSFLGPIRDVAEFHDCQRLIVKEPDGQLKYGALAAVFARPRLDTVRFTAIARPVTVPTTPPSTPVAGSAGPGTTTASAAVLGELVVLGLVYLPYHGGYDPFKLKAPLSCIVASPTLTAWLVPEDIKSVNPCQRSFTATEINSSPSLEMRVAYLSSTGRDVPPVARWDFDSVRTEHFIGIRCGTAWCEIGVRGFTSSASYVGSASAPNNKRFAVKGWYDEQHLAHYPASGITPGTNLGTVVPSEELENWTTLDQADGVWMPVAQVFMRPGAGPYEASMNFGGANRPPPEASATTISFCRGSSKTCFPRNRFSRFRSTACGLSESDVAIFGAIRRAGHPPRYVCVKYRHHGAGAIIPAVVRWRWRPDDETVWIRCPEGCCEVQAD